MWFAFSALLILGIALIVWGVVWMALPLRSVQTGTGPTPHLKFGALEISHVRMPFWPIIAGVLLCCAAVYLKDSLPVEDDVAVRLPERDWHIHAYACQISENDHTMLRNVIRRHMGFRRGRDSYKPARTPNLAPTSSVIYYGGNAGRAEAFASELTRRTGTVFGIVRGLGAGARLVAPEQTLIVNWIGKECEEPTGFWSWFA